MDEHAELREMIIEGKDKLEWYRQVDPAKLTALKDLINAPNYKENMTTLIKTIYEFAFATYSGKINILKNMKTVQTPFTSDLPRGPVKNNSMKKLAAKTLMEILPEDIAKFVEKKLEEQNVSPEFLTLIGMVTYYGDAEGPKA